MALGKNKLVSRTLSPAAGVFLFATVTTFLGVRGFEISTDFILLAYALTLVGGVAYLLWVILAHNKLGHYRCNNE